MKFYLGFSKNLHNRLEEHNNGLVKSTKHRIPLELVYWEGCRMGRCPVLFWSTQRVDLQHQTWFLEMPLCYFFYLQCSQGDFYFYLEVLYLAHNLALSRTRLFLHLERFIH